MLFKTIFRSSWSSSLKYSVILNIDESVKLLIPLNDKLVDVFGRKSGMLLVETIVNVNSLLTLLLESSIVNFAQLYS